jgi:two-component system LytT family response regulator
MSDLGQRLMSVLSTYGERDGTPAPAPTPAAPDPWVRRLAIRDAGRVVFLDVDEIEYIEAADYYVQIHAGGKAYLHRETMQSLEARLEPERFMRIHRSAIVNSRRIRELRSEGRRDLVVVLTSGAELRVARSHREKFQHLR